MATRSRRILDISITTLALSLLIVPSARPVTGAGGGSLLENFSSDGHADYAATTGLWDTVNHQARAGVVTNADPNAPISFGNGSDGDFNISGSYVFDTNSHPNGFNFRSVNISGNGTVTASGSHPLVIRSLTTVDIAATVNFNVDGNPGLPGNLDSSLAGAGGAAATCDGGQGGAGAGAVAGAWGPAAHDGFFYDLTSDAATAGNSTNVANTPGDNATQSAPGPKHPNAANFDTGGFICGPGGGGGGASTTGGVGTNQFATGGGGGGGGGRVRIVSVGAMNVLTPISAKGGASGRGTTNGSDVCSGSGAGGNGGAVWLQTLGNMNAVLPDVSAGLGTTNACAGVPDDGIAGDQRKDSAGVGANGTTQAAPSQTYRIQSKGYSLGTLNAGFSEAPAISASAGDGSMPGVAFAGSADGASYSDFTSDIKTLSGKKYSYLKFRITLTTGGAAGNSPVVNSISLNYTDLGLEKLDLKISAGCGSLVGMSDGSSDGSGPRGPANPLALAQYLAGWLAFWLVAYRALRYGFVVKM